jgi:DNA-directed RNA polymerase specialized sigma24 family protein
MTLEEYNKAVDIYADNLYRFILKNCRNETLAQDVVQDSFEKLWMKIEGVEGAKVKSYLFTTAYHHSEQFSDLGEVLQDALSRIPEIQRTVILLSDYEGYTYEEIGKITELTESQVKVYIYRGRISLKGYLMKIENII